jgi:hypothetical protein
MIDRRSAFRLALAGFAGGWLFHASTARAEPAFKRFLPLLIDLDGWQGKKPDGMSMEMGETSMTTATRDYQHDKAQLHASIVVGQAAVGALAATAAGMNVETSDGHMITSTINGFKATKSFTSKDKSGAILVALGEAAMFSVAYSGLTEEEALPLAQKFDWKAIQTMALQK